MRTQKILPIVLGCAVFAISAIAVLSQEIQQSRIYPSSGSTAMPSPTPTPSTPTLAHTPVPAPTHTPTGIPSYTLAQVAKHNSTASCWTAINGNVYDLTKWIPQHPGGEAAILSICGNDGSSAFNNQHGGQMKQQEILKTFKIGLLTP